MPHFRKRYLQIILEKSLRAGPILGVLGQRQTGKTSLIERIAAEYITLDDEEQLELSLKSSKSFIENRKAPFAIDECQQSAPLFPALKEFVRKQKKTGQFILSGSVRFTSVEEIKESLTGRMIDLELLPLCLSEAQENELFDLRALACSPDFFARVKKRHHLKIYSLDQIKEFLIKGGLPGICFLRSDSLRVKKTRSHIKTILDRDLRIVTKTTLDYLTIKTFLEEIVLQQGEVFDLSKAARGARIALNSARKLLSGLESVYLIRSLRKEGNTSGKLIYFEDQGTATFLLKERGFSPAGLNANELNRFLFQQLMAQISYNPLIQANFFTYRSKGGMIMDFVVNIEGHTLAYSVGSGKNASPHQIQSAEAFQKKYPNAKILLLHNGDSVRQLAPQIVEAPITAIL